jgi:hypothetical protein
MLYCLTQDVYSDIMAMQGHLHSKYDTTNCKFLDILPEHVRLCEINSLIFAAARHIRNANEWQHATMVVRYWCSTNNPFSSDVVDKNFEYKDGEKGFWAYRYAACSSSKLLVSTELFSTYISVIGEVPYYEIDNELSKGEYTIEEIAKSNQKFKMDALFPPNPNMFADLNVDYKIPYSLII